MGPCVYVRIATRTMRAEDAVPIAYMVQMT